MNALLALAVGQAGQRVPVGQQEGEVGERSGPQRHEPSGELEESPRVATREQDRPERDEGGDERGNRIELQDDDRGDDQKPLQEQPPPRQPLWIVNSEIDGWSRRRGRDRRLGHGKALHLNVAVPSVHLESRLRRPFRPVARRRDT